MSADPSWEWERLPFILEAWLTWQNFWLPLLGTLVGTPCKAMGKEQDLFLESAQSSLKNARMQSMQAGFNLWKEQLANDQTMHEAKILKPLGFPALF